VVIKRENDNENGMKLVFHLTIV